MRTGSAAPPVVVPAAGGGDGVVVAPWPRGPPAQQDLRKLARLLVDLDDEVGRTALGDHIIFDYLLPEFERPDVAVDRVQELLRGSSGMSCCCFLRPFSVPFVCLPMFRFVSFFVLNLLANRRRPPPPRLLLTN